MSIEIVCEDRRWDRLDLTAIAARVEIALAEALSLDPDTTEASLLACDDARIAALNADHRGKPRPTNVLSWPAEERGAARDGVDPDPPEPDWDGTIALGDMALAWETCQREAVAAGIPPEAHVTHLVLHGMLHLLGYDHERDGDAALMEGLETTILGKMGIADPYRSDMPG